ncbi:hypothetical protein SAY87_023529 [Trapa incisa]|uniref:HMA domain-containing protein n=1 Tax=Trapa incisa TaxID=236973 RepID=A0AAN7L3M7_9MYRT|nr:hypothetical protein SAY87_023529 [Trapa incisa]
MASKTTEGVQEHLKYQTWTLKVPIHCRGCERKVKRVLHSIHGVFTSSIDTKQHKVTVTGDVDSETLIKKLVRSGKQAELWPKKKSGKANKKDGENANNDPKENHAQEDQAAAATGKAEKDIKSAENEGADYSGDEEENSSPEADDKAREAKAAEGGGEGGGGGKKKKKRKKKKTGQNAVSADQAGKDTNTDSDHHRVAGGDAASISPASSSMYPPPDHFADHEFLLPISHYAPVMFSSASNSNGGLSYYWCATPIHHSLLYSHEVGLHPPPDLIDSYHDRVHDPYDYDDDDDEVGCSIM